MYVLSPPELDVESYASVRDNRVVDMTPDHDRAAHFTGRAGAAIVAKTSPIRLVVIECACPAPWPARRE